MGGLRTLSQGGWPRWWTWQIQWLQHHWFRYASTNLSLSFQAPFLQHSASPSTSNVRVKQKSGIIVTVVNPNNKTSRIELWMGSSKPSGHSNIGGLANWVGPTAVWGKSSIHQVRDYDMTTFGRIMLVLATKPHSMIFHDIPWGHLRSEPLGQQAGCGGRGRYVHRCGVLCVPDEVPGSSIIENGSEKSLLVPLVNIKR